MAFKLIKNKTTIKIFIKYLRRLYKNKEIVVYKCNECNECNDCNKSYPCIIFHGKEDEPRMIPNKCPF